MEIRRTANAGVLLKLDGVSILLDGVCREVKPYPATPPEEREALTGSWPDVVAFTHAHKDHYDPAFAAAYQRQTGGVILGPADLPGVRAAMTVTHCGVVEITPLRSRHLGAEGKTASHASFFIRGSKTVFFTGDAAPGQWSRKGNLPAIDVLLAPYAYANTSAGWAVTEGLSPGAVVLLHMPDRRGDGAVLWKAVEETTANAPIRPYIPAMCETIKL